MDNDNESCVSPTTSPMINFSGNGVSADGLLAAYSNFKRSGLPARFLRFDGDKWLDDIPDSAHNLLRDAFSAGRTATDLAIDGRRYLFDFLAMCMVDWSTAAKHSIAWIDVDGHSFYPQEFAGMSSSSLEVVRPRRQWPGAFCLNDTSDVYRGLERLFKRGLREIDSGADLVAAHRRVGSDERMRERYRKFKEFEERLRCIRGNANWKFGWYGGPPNAIASILENGFSEADISLRLTPAARKIPNISIFSAEPDEFKERHLLLCRVILGNAEQVATDYKQMQRSSDEFDSGVDNCRCPTQYIIWGENMNSQVIPECILTFKSSVLDPPIAREYSLGFPVSKLLSEIDGLNLSSRVEEHLQSTQGKLPV